MSTSSITELAKRIAENTAKVNDFHQARNLPLPGFEQSSPLRSSVDDPEIEAARQAVIFDCQELRILMQGPAQYLASFNSSDFVGLQGITRFNLATAFPPNSETTFAQLAQHAGIGETHMRRLLRLCTSQHIFTEPREGVLAHTAASRLLAEDKLLRQCLAWRSGASWAAALQTCAAMAKWPGSEEPTETGFALAHGGKGMWEYLSGDKDTLEVFADTMRFYTRIPGLEPVHVVKGYPWGELPDGATVVDVGGSHGEISCAIAREFPQLKFVVQDHDEPVIKEAERQRPADVADRVEYAVHDFLTEQPVRGADVYFFRAVLHNWPDKYAVRILQSIVPALKPGSKIVIQDVVTPRLEEVERSKEVMLRTTNMGMHQLFNASNREYSEYEKLFRDADSRFELKVCSKKGSLWILEAEWRA